MEKANYIAGVCLYAGIVIRTCNRSDETTINIQFRRDDTFCNAVDFTKNKNKLSSVSNWKTDTAEYILGWY